MWEYNGDVKHDAEGRRYTNQSLGAGLQYFTTIQPGGGGISAFCGDVPVSGSLPFVGKSAADKFAMCHVVPGWQPNQTLEAGVIRTVQLPMWGGSRPMETNMYLANDLIDICNDILRLNWYKLYIGNSFRRNTSAGGKSRHQIGCAVDVNPGSGGNPWFNTHIQKDFPEPSQGSSAPWATKSCPYHGGYDRSHCIWHWGHPVVQIFLKHGWGWGGSYGDVMHFSLDGR